MVPTVSWPTHLRRVKLSPSESIHLRSICYFKANYFGNPPNHTAKMLWIPQKGSYTSPIPQLSVILRFYPVLSTLCIRKVPQHMQFLQDLQSLLLLIAEDEVLPTCQGKWDQTILVFFSGQFGQEKNEVQQCWYRLHPKHMLLGDLPHVNDNTSDNTSWRDLILQFWGGNSLPK